MSAKKRILLWAATIAAAAGCGVRGDPVPPDAPAVLGRGSPRYQDAARRLKVPPVPTAQQIKDLERQKEVAEEEAKKEEQKK